MSDIVEKLRKLRTPYEHPSTVYKEAADEIEQLRGEVARLKDQIADDVIFKALREKIERLRLELDNAKAAIKEAADALSGWEEVEGE